MAIKSLTALNSLARTHTEQAISTLQMLMVDQHTPPGVRMMAAVHLLNRGWGMPKEAADTPDSERITKIVHEIIHRTAEEALMLDAPLEITWTGGNGKNGH